MRVLVACEFSGTVRDAFRALGHDAMSCDLLPTEAPGPHYQGDVRDVLGDGWDLMVAHPPCTYVCSSGLHWNRRVPGRDALTEAALAFVRELLDAPIHSIALENPVGRIGTAIRKADQIVQPYQFGHDASKATCLWLKNLPPLRPTAFVEPRYVDGKPRWANQTDSGQNRLAPSADRWAQRSETYAGIARAMAAQWGGKLLVADTSTVSPSPGNTHESSRKPPPPKGRVARSIRAGGATSTSSPGEQSLTSTVDKPWKTG